MIEEAGEAEVGVEIEGERENLIRDSYFVPPDGLTIIAPSNRSTISDDQRCS